MTTQTQSQSQEARDAVVAEWDRTKGNLAETQKNLDLMQRTLTAYHRKNGNFISVAILRAVVDSLRDQLDWLAVPATTPATPKLRGSLADRLYQVGVRPSEHFSHVEQQRLDAEDEAKSKNRRDESVIQNERRSLKKQLFEAQNIVVQSRVVGGRIDHSESRRQSEAATAVVVELIRRFNSRVPESERLSLEGVK